MNQFSSVEVGVSQRVRTLSSRVIGHSLRSLQLGGLLVMRLPHLLKKIPMLGRFYRVLRSGTRHDLPMDGDERSWAYGLRAGRHHVVVAFNRSPHPVRRRIGLCSLGIADGTELQGLTHDSRPIARDGGIDVCLEGSGVRVFMGRGPKPTSHVPSVESI